MLVVILAALAGIAATTAGVYVNFIKDSQPSLQQIGSLGRIQQCAYQKQVVKLILFIGAGCLCFSQILLATLGGCVCCVTLQYSPGTAHRWSMVLFGLSWIFFWLAELIYLSGAYINDYHTSQTVFEYDYDLRKCFKVKPFVYIVGAICCLLACITSILYYGQAQKSKYEAWVEYGAPTPRVYSKQTKKSFVIAGPAKRGPLKNDEDHNVPLLD